MSKQYSGGLITKTPVVPTSLSASGIWSLSDQAEAQASNTWPFPRDPQFNYVTMLLHGDGSAGAVAMGSGAGTSSTVTNFNADASTNNFNVTINGDARSNNFTPYQGDGYYSNYFDGSSYLQVAYNAALDASTGPFTYEAWLNPSSTASKQYLGGSVTNAFFAFVGSGTIFVGRNNVAVDFTSSATIVTNQWNHVVIVRNSSNNIAIFINGASAYYAASNTNNYGLASNPLRIGVATTGTSYEYNGYISNVRISKSALYDPTASTITVPTAPLTAGSAGLLTCQSNRFIDNSGNTFTITTSGTPQVSPAVPFTLPTTVATYGSGYFDGTGDYLGVTGATTALAFGSGDFTIEFWGYILQTTPEQMFIDWRPAGTQTTQPLIYVTSAGVLAYYVNAANRITGATLVTGQWYHIAVSRSGTSTKMFLNGVQTGSTWTDTTVYTNTSTRPLIGLDGNTTSSGYLKGNVTDVRTLTGTALYTTTFTPPTAPLTAITNTSLLTTQYNGGGNNSGFKDSSQFNFPITRNGNTTQGTFTPYGANWSANFAASSTTYLSAASNAAFAFGTGDFTMEAFVFATASQTDNWIIGLASNCWFRVGSGGALEFYNSVTSTSTLASTALPLNTWTHVAVVRSGTALTIYQNGVSVGTATVSTNFSSSVACTIGNQVGFDRRWNGYISNARVVKGTAVYTAAFTPSTTPLTAISGTSLLTCQSNRFIDNSTNAFTLTVSGSPSVQRFSPFAPLTVYNPATYGGSMYMDGTTDFVKTPSDANLSSTLLASNFTIECWIYVISLPNAPSIWTNSVSNSDGFSGSYVQTNGTIGTGKFGVNEFNTTNSIKLNSWNHFALVRNSGTLYVYLNGVQDPTTGAASTYLNTSATKPMQIGSSNQSPPAALNGYISDFRVVTSALYTASFTVNTTPLTVVTGTNLLLNTTNPAILDNAMMNNLETVGNAAVSTSVKKYGAASMVFDGVGDYLTVPASPNFIFGTGDFTVEFWVQEITSWNPAGGSNYAHWISLNSYTTGIMIRPNLTGTAVEVWVGNTSYTFTTTLSLGVWYHIAVSRASSSMRFFVNGTQIGTTQTVTYNISTNTANTIGTAVHSTSEVMQGYIDDLRITKYGRYTANFTAPDQAFPNG